MKNVAVYYRCSTDKQDLDSQEVAVLVWLDALVPDKRPEKILEFKDESMSGKTTNRPGFQAMMEAAMSGKIDTIICYRLDRFSRDANTAIKLLLTLDEMGVAFVSITQPVLNLGHENPFRRTMLAAFAEIAEIERETIVGRVNAGLAAARKRGVKLGRKKKVSDKLVKRIKELHNEGHTFRQICQAEKISLGSVHRALKQI